jgi:hypothetical protein
LAVAVHHGHEVEALADGVGVAHLLVATVPLVVLVAEDRHPDLRMGAAVGAADRVRAVVGGVVDDQDLAVEVAEDRAWDALEDRREGVLRVVGDDEDEEARLAGADHDDGGPRPRAASDRPQR